MSLKRSGKLFGYIRNLINRQYLKYINAHIKKNMCIFYLVIET